MSPNNAELIIPKFIVRDRKQEIEYWDAQMKLALDKMEQHDLEVGPNFLWNHNIISTKRDALFSAQGTDNDPRRGHRAFAET